MNQAIPLWQRLKLGTVMAAVAALGMNAAIGLLMLHSPDGARLMAMHEGQTSSMVADLGSLATVQVCARRLPA